MQVLALVRSVVRIQNYIGKLLQHLPYNLSIELTVNCESGCCLLQLQ